MNPNVLVTGGLGFIGHRVVNCLAKAHCAVTIIDNQNDYGIIPLPELTYLNAERRQSITDTEIVYRCITDDGIKHTFDSAQPDIVVHLASFPRQKVVNQDPVTGSHSMIGGLLNLLENSVRNGVKRFVYISSSMVYGDFHDQVTENAPTNPLGQYGIMKLAGEWLVKDYTTRHGIEHVIIRPSAVYGPLDVEDRVVSKFLISAMQGKVLQVNGADEGLDFSYVQDTANGIAGATLSNNTANNTYNITRGRSRTLLEAAELAVQLVGKGSIQINNRDLKFPSRGSLCINAAQKDFGYNPTINIEQGFKTYYEWLNNSVFWNQKTIQQS